MEQIVLKPQVLFQIGFFPVTNTIFVSWIVVLTLVVISFIISKTVKLVPGGLQNIVEIIIETGYSQVESLAGVARAKVFFPIVMTFFLFIFVGNWLGLLPGFGTITFRGVPLFRSLNSDLNMTLGLALLSALITHAFAIKYLGIKDYLKRWVSLNPIFLFVGLLEIVSEFTKIVSLSFRLFGNIFAGEVVLSTVSSIFAFVVPLPFTFLEIIVGFVQAAVFMMLTLVFMVLLTEKHETH
jgi:F-type H+-transporting ATPase subunit a